MCGHIVRTSAAVNFDVYWVDWKRVPRPLYLLIRVQQEAIPNGAKPRGGKHRTPLSGATGGRRGAAEQRHQSSHQHYGVVQGKKKAV